MNNVESRVYLGLAGVIDLETEWEPHVWERLVREHHISRSDLGFHGPINTLRDAVRVVLTFLAESRGGEVRVNVPSISFALGELIRHKTTLGGTNLRAAGVLKQFGIPSIAQVSAVDETMRSLVPANCKLLAAKNVERLVPNIVIQYPVGARIEMAEGEVVSSRADRVILANDINIQNPSFPPAMPSILERSRLAMISSLNAVTTESGVRPLLDQLVQALQHRRSDSYFIWEDAGYHNPGLQMLVAKAVAPLVDVFSMNIEEATAITERPIDIWNPAEIISTLSLLQDALGAPNVVVHCEGWATVRGPDAAMMRPALELGQAVASARWAMGDAADRRDYRYLKEEGIHSGPAGFAQELHLMDPTVELAPSYRLDNHRGVTLGLGDAFVGGVLAALWEQLPES